MANNKNRMVNFQKEKKKATTKKVVKAFRIPIAILAVLIVCLVIFLAKGETGRSNFTDSFKAIPATLGENPGYPYSGSDLSLQKLMTVGDKPMLISESSVRVLSQDAAELQEIYPDWADTRAFSQNGRAVLYSNTSNKAYLISRTGILAKFNENDIITTATVANNGGVALSVSESKIQSVVKVYSDTQKDLFQWNCSKDYVSSLSLSPNGKKLVVSALGVNNAEIYSRVLLFDTKKSDAVFEAKLTGTTVLKVVYASGNRFVAIGDNCTVIFDKKGNIIGKKEYDANSLFAVDSDSNGNTLVCYNELGGTKINVVTITSSGKIKDFELEYAPSAIDMKGNQIAVALDNTVTVYSTTGKEKNKYECANNVSTVLITSTGIFTLESGTVCKY